MTKNNELSPGEARTRTRQRRQIIYIASAGVAGGLIGFFTGFFDQGDGNLFSGDWEELSLPPAVAVALAVGLILAFVAMPLWGFSQIDDYKSKQNLVAFTGGCIAVIAGFPVWATLYAGGFLPPPDAFGIWLIAFGAMIVSFGYAKWRL